MEKTILYVDDAAYACQLLAQRATSGSSAPVHWIVVACAPRMTHRISKWVSHSARENWRAKWFAKTMDQLHPALVEGGNEVTAQLAVRPLLETTQQLRLLHGAAAQVVDARRPKAGVALEPVAPEQPKGPRQGWLAPGAASLGALFVLASSLGE
ncbi:hypothetical protein QTH91_09150 [Variovorax dokdonensis]|uniref:Uncharacterized protein n=1 Tax=Variovorax dokdonensis TaxID=344883 RepID=A0ABT7N9V9_9BURK|nr:hypothetical protein [Variovorax dokdonensis]MDM0044645.1 hypothetical protein [Variovorax dokdonensis]